MSGRAADTERAHLEGLRTWGIERVAVRRDAPVAAPSPEPTQESEVHAPAGDRAEVLRQCSEEVAECTRCRLAETRTKTVFGVGDPQARLMFIGEAPGRDEDLKGEPFVGRAGQLLDKIIAAMGLRRDEVYIANILKCRPPGNRDPMADETASCTPFLVRQIRAIQPEIIVALGKPAANYLLSNTESLGRMRGRAHHYEGIVVYVTYHPAYLLRNPAGKVKTWEDIQRVMRDLDLPLPG